MPWPWETLARPWRPGRSRAGLNGAVPSSARQNVSPGGKGDDEILPPPEPRSISSPKTVGCVLAPASAHQPDLQLGRVLMRMSA